MKRRICVVVQSYYLRDPRVRREAEALSEAGYEVDVLTLKDKGEPWSETVNGVRIYRLPLGRKRASKLRYMFEYGLFLVLAGFAETLLHIRRRYSLVHINNMPDILVFSALLPKLTGTKVLLDVHDPMPEMFISKYGLDENSLLIRLLAFQERISCRFADFVLTVSEIMEDRLVSCGVPRAKTGVVLNVPDRKIFRRLQSENSEGKQSNGSFTLLYAGTVAERYGLDLAMRAVTELQSRCPGLKMKIVGEGDHMPYLRRLNEELGAKCVEFQPPVPITKVPELAQSCDAAIQPHLQDCHMDLYFSTKVVEAMAMGLPVIASSTKTLKRYFTDSQVVFVEPGNKDDLVRGIERLYKEKQLRYSLIESGSELAERFNWDMERHKFLNIIESIILRKRDSVKGAAVD